MRYIKNGWLAFGMALLILLAGWLREEGKDVAITAKPEAVATIPQEPLSIARSSPYESEVKLLLKVASKGEAHMVSTFRGPGDLLGVVFDPGNGRRLTGWTDGKHLFLGPVFDLRGRDITALAMDRLGQFPAQSQPERVYGDAQKLDSVLVGTDGPMIIAFVDANCPYCRRLYEGLDPFVKGGKLRVSYVPVAMVKDSSVGRGAALLAANDRASALAQDAANFNEGSEEGGLAPLDNPPQEVLSHLTTNTRFLFALEPDATTPTILFKTSAGFQVLSHLPQDLPQFVASLRS